MDSNDKRPLSEMDAMLIRMREQQITIARQNEKIIEQDKILQQQKEELDELRKKSKTDFLTGLLNRDGIAEIVELLNNSNYSVVLCDIDNFKSINDTYGHAAGDMVLQKVKYFADLIMRTGDYTGRFGGDEFLFILEGCSAENAKIKCDKLEQLIQEQSLSEFGFNISMSFGIAYHKPGVDYYTVRENADEALYESKKAGKAKATIYEEGRNK